MKKIFYALSLAVALLTTSCTKDTTEDILNGGNNGDNQVAMTTITVGINNATRVHLGDENDSYMPLYWSEGDVMEINGSALKSNPIAAEYNGKVSAVIEVPEDATFPMTLIYPESAGKNTADYFYIPTEQEYDPTKLANGNAIMMGYVASADDNNAVMKHLCGYIKVSLKGSAIVKRLNLRAIGHEPISGYHCQTITADEISMIDYDKIGIAEGEHTSPVISITSKEGVALKADEVTDFYFAVPEGNYSKGFALTVVDDQGMSQVVAAYKNGKEIKAGVMTKMKPLTVNCTKLFGIYDQNEWIGYTLTHDRNSWALNGEVNLRAWIDMTGTEDMDIPQLYYRSGYYKQAKVLNGNNFGLYNFKRTSTEKQSALFMYTLPEDVTIKNLSIGKPVAEGQEADSEFIVRTTGVTSGVTYTAIFNYNPYGTLENCTNNATLKMIPDGTCNCGVRMGGFTSGGGDSAMIGTIKNCTNNGDIYLDTTNMTACTGICIGGITGRQQGGTITGCTNTGKIVSKSEAIGASAIFAGGIVGRGYNDAEDCPNVTTPTLTDCTNRGKLDIDFTTCGKTFGIGGIIGDGWSTQVKTAEFSGHSNYGVIDVNFDYSTGWSSIGGIGGLVYCDVTNCTNYAAGTVASTDNQGSNTGTNRQTHLAGVIGTIATAAGYVVDNCNNHASVTNNTNGSAETNTGGILGYASQENKTSPNIIKNCTNSGTIKHTGKGLSSVGGITGMAGRIENCTNSGAVIQENSECTYACPVGGVAGRLSYPMISCSNYGNVSTANANSYTGGLAGWTTYDKASIDKCNSDCDIVGNTRTGYIIGTVASRNITASNTKIYGTMKRNGESVAISTDVSVLFGHKSTGSLTATNVTVESTKPAN